MKAIKTFLNTERGAGVFLVIGINCLYGLVGFALYNTIGLVFGLIPVVTSLGLTGALLPRLVKPNNDQQPINYEQDDIEEIIFIKESITKKNEKDLKKEQTAEKANPLNHYSQESTSSKSSSESIKVLVKNYKN